MHITASVFINDNEPGLHADYERWLEQLAPFNAGGDPAQGGYLHNRTGNRLSRALASLRLCVSSLVRSAPVHPSASKKKTQRRKDAETLESFRAGRPCSHCSGDMLVGRLALSHEDTTIGRAMRSSEN
jgi:hypothetical protein